MLNPRYFLKVKLPNQKSQAKVAIRMFVDTHCHIHDPEFYEKSELEADEILQNAKEAGVDKLICVGTSVESSRLAVEFANKHDSCSVSLAIHPHEAENYTDSQLDQQIKKLAEIADKHPERLVAIGECGLDYFYHSATEVYAKQQKLLTLHLKLAQKLDLPLIFHIRDSKERTDGKLGQAFADFFQIVDGFEGVRGVIHSFSATTTELEGVIKRGFYVGLNGIMTFTKDEKQLEAAKKVPLSQLILETDAPFLTPKPFRGTMCEPKHVVRVAEFLSELRGESLELLAEKTSTNAKRLFNL